MNIYSNYNNNPYFPFDACVISLKMPLSSSFCSDPESFRGGELREVKQGTKLVRDLDYRFITWDVGTYGGLQLFGAQSDGGKCFLRRIRFNPGKLLFGHNGRALTQEQALTALSMIPGLVAPFLQNEEEASKVVPGVEGSNAFWRSVEIVRHVSGKDFGTFRNVRHPWIRTVAQRYEGESSKLGKRRSDFTLNFYLKDVELGSKLLPGETLVYPGKEEAEGVLRVEASLSGKRLVDMLGGQNHTSIIDGTKRLTSFTAQMLQQAHWKICSQLQGCFLPQQGTRSNRDKLARLMAVISAHSGVPIDFQLGLYKERFRPSSAQLTRLSSAAIDEASH